MPRRVDTGGHVRSSQFAKRFHQQPTFFVGSQITSVNQNISIRDQGIFPPGNLSRVSRQRRVVTTLLPN